MVVKVRFYEDIYYALRQPVISYGPCAMRRCSAEVRRVRV